MRKRIYLIFVFVLVLIGMNLYTTYSIFESTLEINETVGIDTKLLKLNTNLNEYEMFKIYPGKELLIELNVNNDSNNLLYYKAWYEMVKPNIKNENIDLGIYTQKINVESKGTLKAKNTINFIIGLNNLSDSEIIVNIGVDSSKNNYPNLDEGKIELPINYVTTKVVNSGLLEKNSTYIDEPFNLIYNYSGSVERTTLMPGTYKLETWGAQGGIWNENIGGKGGYSYGTLSLKKNTTIYSRVGGQGGAEIGGFNGGSDSNGRGAAGGGASDIRIGQDSLYSRVIVAGGGGGAGWKNSNLGGFGGGIIGGEGTTTNQATGGGGGTQTSGGSSTQKNGEGLFGLGGGTATFGGGGGGGWYGGGHGKNAVTAFSAGGGGSGYVYTSNTAVNYPVGCLLNSEYYLTDAVTSGDNKTGNGMIKISGISKKKVYNIPVLKGINDITILKGTNYDLMKDISLICENGKAECKFIKTSINDTSMLDVGNYIIDYVVEGSDKKKYIFKRNLYVNNEGITPSKMTLINLGLESSIKTDIPNFANTSCSNGCEESTVGIYMARDDLGDSYYFRGDVENNYVFFAGYYWRIIRINGDGTVRIIYDGTSPHANGESNIDRQIGESSYNKEHNNSKYVSYMYDNYTIDSDIKKYIDNWYKTNIVDKGFDINVADGIFCNDTSLDPNYNNTEKDILYGAYSRTWNDIIPSLICEKNSDKYTIFNDTNLKGNGKLLYPIGLITADEAHIAGGKKNNNKYFLYTGSWYWSMSPAYFGKGKAYTFEVFSGGGINYFAINRSGGVKVVINLNSDAIKSGKGLINDSFIA